MIANFYKWFGVVWKSMFYVKDKGSNVCVSTRSYFDPWYTFTCNYLQASFHVLNLITSLGSFSEFLHFFESVENVWHLLSWDILLTDILHCLLLILFLLQEGGYGSRKGTVGLWGLSRSAGSFPPISHLLMRAILPRTSIYNIQDMVSKIGYPKQLTDFIWVGGGGSTFILSFCVNSCRARGQNGSTVKPLS